MTNTTQTIQSTQTNQKTVLDNITVKTEVEPTNNKIRNLKDIERKFKHLENKETEDFYVILIDEDHNEIGTKKIASGDESTVEFKTKELYRTALLVEAEAVIIVHNHPSGNPKPTNPDLETTRQLKEGFDNIGLQFLDHVIVSKNGSYSMKKHNLCGL